MGGNADRMFPAPAAELSFNNPVAQRNPIMGKLKQEMIEGCADQVPAEVREAEKRTFSILQKFWDESAGR